jgi:hypothetical protein
LRGTLHLLAAEDVGWLVPLIVPTAIASSKRRYQQLGLDEDIFIRSTQVIQKVLPQGPMLRSEIAQDLEKNGIDVSGQRIAHIVRYAALEGLICLGPDRGHEPTYVLLKDWITIGSTTPGEGLAELARRYLNGYGPAEPGDFAVWSGFGMKAARTAWSLIADELEEVTVEQRSAWLLKKQSHSLQEMLHDSSVIRLLPAFDAYLLGYDVRDFAVVPENQSLIFHGGQMVPAIISDGCAVGTWRYRQRGKSLNITINPFAEFSTEMKQSIKEETDDIGRFFGLSTNTSLANGLTL